jgi:beta-galactosidase-like protein
LFIRSDVRGVSERSLSLQSLGEQHISYIDPRSHTRRIIPQYSHLLLRREQTRLLPLNLPVRPQETLVYSTADLLGRYAYGDRTWLVFYGEPGEIGEVALRFSDKPVDLNHQVIWSNENQEATLLLPFSTRDQVVPITNNISLLLISRERAYHAKEFSIRNEPALLISGADDALIEQSGQTVTFDLQSRHPLGRFTLLAGKQPTKVRADHRPTSLEQSAGTFQFSAEIAVPVLTLPDESAAFSKSWSSFNASVHKTVGRLDSLSRLEMWNKGISHCHTSFPGKNSALQFGFFTDDYKAVYINGEFAPEASNRSANSLLLAPCALRNPCIRASRCKAVNGRLARLHARCAGSGVSERTISGTSRTGPDTEYWPGRHLFAAFDVERPEHSAFCCLRADSAAPAASANSGRAGQHPKKS